VTPSPKPTPTASARPTPTPATITDNPIAAGPGTIFNLDHIAYIIGYEDGTVRPERFVTRAEVVTVFYRLLNNDIREAYWARSNAFTDVKSSDWHNYAISVIGNFDIIKGYEDGTFKPDASITRAELAAISARFADKMKMKGNRTILFTDITGHWAEDEISKAASYGWLNGYPDGSFKPDQPINRAEFITIINNMLERVLETADDLMADRMAKWSDNADSGAWYYLAVQEATNSHESEKTGRQVPGAQFEYEYWTGMLQNPDWIQLEMEWIAEYSTP
jgi:hypothetical protein